TGAEPTLDLSTTRGRIGTKDLCSAAARCDPYASISCSTTVVGATCEGHDRNCAAGERGFVRCDTNYTYCPPCGCTEAPTATCRRATAATSSRSSGSSSA